MTSSGPDPVLVTARTYEDEANAWRTHTAVDRGAWQPSYDRMAADLPSGALVLDLGCGSGEDVPAFASMNCRIVGLDISLPLLTVAATRDQISGRLIQADLRSLPFPDSSFDGVWACGSLHHVSKADAKGAVHEAARVLKAGGVLGVSVEMGQGEGFVANEAGITGPRWYSLYGPDELASLLQAEGFKIRDQIIGGASEHSTNGFIAIFASKR